MNIREIIQRLLPNGTDAFAEMTAEEGNACNDNTLLDCPNWPPDLFAIAGRIIEQSGCYTMASPQRGDLTAHQEALKSRAQVVKEWNSDPLSPPIFLLDLWLELVTIHGDKAIDSIESDPAAVTCVLKLFAIADESCKGMGWGADVKDDATFSQLLRLTMTGAGSLKLHLPLSLCCKVSPNEIVVLPKSTTVSVGCTIRSLSHYLYLLPPTTVVKTSWTLPFARELEEGQMQPQDP